MDASLLADINRSYNPICQGWLIIGFYAIRANPPLFVDMDDYMLMFRPISLIIYVFVSTSPNFFHGICQVDISSTRIFEDSNTPEVTNRAHENHRTSLGGELNQPSNRDTFDHQQMGI